jgi:hypothetical protein
MRGLPLVFCSRYNKPMKLAAAGGDRSLNTLLKVEWFGAVSGSISSPQNQRHVHGIP